MTIEFELPGLPQTMNQIGRKHWTVKAREARTWRLAVVTRTLQVRPPEPFSKARITCTRCSSIEPDFDNLAISFKHVLDGLIDAKIIENDKASCVSVSYLWEKAFPKKGKVRVRIERGDDASPN